ncbi:MAG TPA: cytochrome c biogenesis protein CcsA [Chloroflexota bacterium]|nr:cytochrome c biogenesis protein CcsA [Chloroflexota bacterium]
MGWLERNGNRIGLVSLPVLGLGVYMGLVWSPPDVHMGQDLRLMYVHVPSIWAAYLALTVSLGASLMVLWKRNLRWDQLAVATTEVGVVLTALAIAAGSIWGKLTWGVWWTWDPRLTTTAVLLVVFVGYLLLRQMFEDPWTRAKYSAVVAIIGFLDIPVVHFSVLWWRSLHQGPTFLRPNLGDPTMDDRMEITLIVNTVAFTLLYLFLLSKRLRLARLTHAAEAVDWGIPRAESRPATEPAHAR